MTSDAAVFDPQRIPASGLIILLDNLWPLRSRCTAWPALQQIGKVEMDMTDAFRLPSDADMGRMPNELI